MQFIKGNKDGIKRKVTELVEPDAPKNNFGVNELKVGYKICQLEFSPGKFATQLVATNRIQHEKSA